MEVDSGLWRCVPHCVCWSLLNSVWLVIKLFWQIKIEHRFIRRPEPRDDDDIDSRLPEPPRDEPSSNHHSERRGVPTLLATVGLPSSVRHQNNDDHSPRGSLDSEDTDLKRPAPKQKPPKPPKPEVKKVRSQWNKLYTKARPEAWFVFLQQIAMFTKDSWKKWRFCNGVLRGSPRIDSCTFHRVRGLCGCVISFSSPAASSDDLFPFLEGGCYARTLFWLTTQVCNTSQHLFIFFKLLFAPN